MSKIADALKDAATGISTISGGKLDERPPGELGSINGGKVDTGVPVEHETKVVGNFEGIAVIPPQNPDPEPGGAWPPANPDVAKAIHEALVPSRAEKEES